MMKAGAVMRFYQLMMDLVNNAVSLLMCKSSLPASGAWNAPYICSTSRVHFMHHES